MKIDFIEMADWPLLTWLAFLDNNSQKLTVWHGVQVETCELGFCEAIWDGEFEKFDFDKTDLIFGSGCRLRDDHITFVSAGSTVDRLQIFHRDDGTCVSNSLACLAEFNDLNVDATSNHYYDDFRSIEKGLSKAVKQLQTDKAPVVLVYFHNIRWDGQQLKVVAKPHGDRKFCNFADFEHFLRQSVSALGHNMRSCARQWRYDPLGTLSTGYDSPVAAILGKGIGCQQVISFNVARDGLGDHGGDIAKCLGLEVISADRNDWRQLELAEVPFLAANGYGEEVHYAAFDNQLQAKALLTGFHGDKVWGKELIDDSDNIVRGDPTGLSLTEYRLWRGFIHCPIPFMGARNVTEINRISNSEELRAWDLPGKYSRPICRRIIEEAGVPREYFGMEKKAASVLMRKRGDAFLSTASNESYHGWLVRQKSQWLRRWRLPPHWRLDLYSWPMGRPLVNQGLALSIKLQGLPGGWRAVKLFEDLKLRPTFPFLFPWALHQARQRYRNPVLNILPPKLASNPESPLCISGGCMTTFKHNGLVSIVIPFYQKEMGLLNRCISSILSQKSFDNYQIIVVDDGSPISARNEICHFLESTDKIKLVEQENAGPGAARNTGLNNVSPDSTYVAFMDSDDWWEEDFLATAIRTLDQGYDLFFVNTTREGVDGNRFAWHSKKNLDLKVTEHNILDSAMETYEFVGDFFDYTIVRSNILATSSTIFRFSCHPNLRFNTKLYNGQDRLFKLALCQKVNKVAFSPRVLVRECKGMNIFDSAQWGTGSSLRLLHNYINLSKTILKEIELSPKHRKEINRQLNESRYSMIASIIHLIKIKTKFDWRLVAKTVINDPVFLVYALPNSLRVIGKNLSK